MTPRQIAEQIVDVARDPSLPRLEIVARIALIIGGEKQDWNRACNKMAEKYINREVEAEREACAKVADDWKWGGTIAAAIRARGTK